MQIRIELFTRRRGDAERLAHTFFAPSRLRVQKTTRHPELVSGSISPPNPSVFVTRWMLKRVQHDGVYISLPSAPPRLRVNPK
jgi:hypothetical protein